MKKTKLDYLSPLTETLVVRFEGNFCGTNYGSKGAAGGTMDTNDYGEDDPKIVCNG